MSAAKQNTPTRSPTCAHGTRTFSPMSAIGGIAMTQASTTLSPAATPLSTSSTCQTHRRLTPIAVNRAE